MAQLGQMLPNKFLSSGQFLTTPAYRHREVVVTRMYFAHQKPWPGKQQFVNLWYVLENGKAIGWNDYPGRGWSFPVITYRDSGP